ncbi:RNA polymerase subunit sigma-70 [Nonomuraea sp. NPDC050310]|uniref:RNA polymerase subunit sigma-70 n=1 Tax=Nonomuraea sp. NPDC050310 TaxID=3154935 RepID=UPI0033D644A2
MDGELLAAARAGDEAAFGRLVAPYRRELAAHCYRMLGSPHDAEDAVQEVLLSAWRGLAGFEGRSSVRTWLYRIATHACLRLASKRPRRLLSPDHGPPRRDVHDLGEVVPGPVWLEPWPDPAAGPEESYLLREGVELAFVAALQHLPPFQRAVLVLREVLEYPAAEVAGLLGSTTAAVNSSLQRARRSVGERVPERGEVEVPGQGEVLKAFIRAWERGDVDGLVELLTDDVRFIMPPLPAWFEGRETVGRFLAERVFASRWRVVPVSVNGGWGMAFYQEGEVAAVGVLRVRSGSSAAARVPAASVGEIVTWLDPRVLGSFPVPRKFSASER